MSFTTYDGETVLVFRNTARCKPSPEELSEANRRGDTKLTIWVKNGPEERWQFIDGHWQAVEHWKEETP